MITRADIQGALKVLNATNTKDRRSAIKAMVRAEHTPNDVDKILSDLVSYAGWGARIDLEPKAPSADALPPETPPSAPK